MGHIKILSSFLKVFFRSSSFCFCLFLFISVRICPFLSVYVCFCLFLCFCLLLSVSFGIFLSLSDVVCFWVFFCFCLFGDFLVLVLLSADIESIVTVYMFFPPHNLSLYSFHKCMATADRAVVVFVKEFQWDQRIGLIHH